MKRRATPARRSLMLLPLVVLLAACTPGGGTGPSPSASVSPTPTPTLSPTPTGTPTSTPTATPPPDDQTAPPHSGDRVISSRISQDWGWPGPDMPFRITHEYTVPIAPPPEPPLPYLYTIGVGQHPASQPPYDQMSFRFRGAFPSYEIEYVPELDGTGSGLPIPMPGTATILRVVFNPAQAHTEDGQSSIVDQPPEVIGFTAISRYASAGDFEAYVTYGIGVGEPVATVPKTLVRVYEVEKIEQGQLLYVVAIQIDATNWR